MIKVLEKKEGQITGQIEKTDAVLFYLYILFGVIAFSMVVTMAYLVYSIFS
jgi:hypothetical protein